MNLMGKKSAAQKGNPYFQTQVFHKNRKRILAAISSLPYREAPSGWVKQNSIAVGGLEYVGFSEDSQHLLVVSSSGRGVYHIPSGEIVARDPAEDGDWLDERHLLCRGIGPLAGGSIRIAGVGGGGLPMATACGDSLSLAAPLFPCYDVVYQPSHQDYLVDGHNSGCATIYRGYVTLCGFSWDGNSMIVVDEDIHLWLRDGIA